VSSYFRGPRCPLPSDCWLAWEGELNDRLNGLALNARKEIERAWQETDTLRTQLREMREDRDKALVELERLRVAKRETRNG
jgi:ABC-type phosphate transport system auxiliary subunit